MVRDYLETEDSLQKKFTKLSNKSCMTKNWKLKLNTNLEHWMMESQLIGPTELFFLNQSLRVAIFTYLKRYQTMSIIY